MCLSENPTYVCLLSNGHMTTFIGFADGSNRYIINLTLTYWVLYSPTGDLVSSWGVCLGPSTNNLVEHHAVIRLLTKVLVPILSPFLG